MISIQNDFISYDEIDAYIKSWTSNLVIDYTIKETLFLSNPSLHVYLDGHRVIASWRVYLGSATLDIGYGLLDDSTHFNQAYFLESIDDVKKYTDDFLNQLQQFEPIY